jgi:hypothetical protein
VSTLSRVKQLSRSLAPVCMVGIATGCGQSGVTGPTQSPLVGAYTLTQLESHFHGVDIDHLAQGARISFELRKDGVAVVDVFIPHGQADGSDIRETGETTWWFFTDSIEPNIRLTTIWVRTQTQVGVWGWRFDGEGLETSQPSCSFAAFNPDIHDCRFDAVLTKAPYQP